MTSIRTGEKNNLKENLKIKLDSPKKDHPRSQSKGFAANDFSYRGKSSSVTKNGSDQKKFSPSKGGAGAGGAGNININVNNLIINNTGNSGYPNNYGMYVPNSSVFSKLGNDIIKSKMNVNSPLLKSNTRKLEANFNINKLSINRSLGNLSSLVQAKGYGESNAAGKHVYAGKFPNLDRNNFVDKVINNLIDGSKRSEPWNENKPVNNFNKVAPRNSHAEVGKEEKQEEIRDSLPVQEKKDISLHFAKVDNGVFDKHVALWDSLIEMETHVENKQTFSLFVKKFSTKLFEEIANSEVEIFSHPAANKNYTKLVKIGAVIIIYLKFILLDFNYEIKLKGNVKQLLTNLNENLYCVIDSFVLKDDSAAIKPPHEFLDKFSKITKQHKLKKFKDNVVLANNLLKTLEISINNIKQFSNNYFKIGYFKPIHSICLELLKTLDSMNLPNIVDVVKNHVLFYITSASIQGNKQGPTVATKQVIFNSGGFVNMSHKDNPLGPPFLPPVEGEVYTLVLDLDETLVHFFFTPSGGSFLIRPGCFTFLNELSELYEIVIFTAAMKDYADNILDLLDKEKRLIKHRLYRHHTSIAGMSFVKDLSKIGRDLSKVIIIDNLPDNFKLQQNNGLPIKTWNDDIKDTQLFDLLPILKAVRTLNVVDVRTAVKKIKEEANKRLKKKMNGQYTNIELSKLL